MSPDQITGPLEALHAHLRETLDQHLGTLTHQHEQALEEARALAAASTEKEVAARTEEIRQEWAARLSAEVEAARADGERRLAAASMNARMEAEQAAAESTARVREELEQALTAERHRADSEIAAGKQRTDAEIAAEQERSQKALAAEQERTQKTIEDARQRAAADLESARQQERQAAIETARAEIAAAREEARQATAKTQAEVSAAREEAKQAQLDAFERLAGGFSAIDSARSLSEALDALLKQAAVAAPRAAVFLINGDRLKSWKGAGFTHDLSQGGPHAIDAPVSVSDLLGQAVQSGEASLLRAGVAAPSFAAVREGSAAIAVPILVGGRPVAVLYADDGGQGATTGASSWPHAVQALGRHASAVLALITAQRSMQAIQGVPAVHGTAATAADDDQSARRYARLLVSEIKLYNEGAVRAGRQQRDLLQRLRPEIDRARRLYEERVAPAVAARGVYFQQELVQTLADGDVTLLGAS